MPRRFTEKDLQEAISYGDIDKVRRILSHRDPNSGVPWVDINGLETSYLGYVTKKDALIYTLEMAQRVHGYGNNATPLFPILQHLLQIRDNNGNPVIEFNRSCVYQFTNMRQRATSQQDTYFKGRLVDIFRQAINLRYNNGVMVCRFNEPEPTIGTLDEAGTSILIDAIKSGLPELVAELVALRNSDGTYVIDINKVVVYDKDYSRVGMYGSPGVPLRGSLLRRNGRRSFGRIS